MPSSKRSKSSTSFVFVSDTHVGNIFAVCSPHPLISQDMTEKKPNHLQERLYAGFMDCVDRLQQPNKIGACFVAGDVVDGPNRKKGAMDIWSVDPLDTVYDAHKILSVITRRSDKVFVIRGSNYHVSPGADTVNYDEMYAQIVSAIPINNRQLQYVHPIRWPSTSYYHKAQEGKRQIAKELAKSDSLIKRDAESRKQMMSAHKKYTQVDIDTLPMPSSGARFKGLFGRVAIAIKHQVSYSPNYMYRSTGLIRNDMLTTLQKERSFPGGYDSIINAYGHVHYFHTAGNETHHNFTIPCWKANDSHLTLNGITDPDYGFVEVIVEPNSDISVHPYTLRGDKYPAEMPYSI
jgi:hypothetical protein